MITALTILLVAVAFLGTYLLVLWVVYPARLDSLRISLYHAWYVIRDEVQFWASIVALIIIAIVMFAAVLVDIN